MTTTTTAMAGVPVRVRRSPRAVPRGMPKWLWLFGVSVQPLDTPAVDGTTTWVVSAGGGTTGIAAVVFDTTEQDRPDITGEDRT